MDERVKTFIEENIELIEDNKWEEVYKKDFPERFTETLLKCGVNPLEQGLSYIPGHFLNKSNIKEFIIPNNIISIRDRAFEKCDSLTNIVIGNSVTSIGFKAFEDCTSLTSVVIPDSVTTIYSEAFSGCRLLKSIVIPNSVTGIGNFVFSGCCIENATIPTIAISNVSKRSLKEVIITSGESIGEDAFKDCDALTSVEISNSVTSIGTDAFFNCSSLTNIEIPNSVTSIGGWAFYGCDSLTEVTIGNSVTNIGKEAFKKCTSLKILKYNGTKEQWKSIDKTDHWNDSILATRVICTDGEILL